MPRTARGAHYLGRILEELSEAVWSRLKASRECGIRQGEETITDILALDLKRRGNGRSGPGLSMSVATVTHALEKRVGADLLWAIGNDAVGWYNLVVQTKRIDLDGGDRYGSLDGSWSQLAALETFAGHPAVGAAPAYFFYNYVSNPDPTRNHWTCCRPLSRKQLPQLGWTIAHASHVRAAMDRYDMRKFRKLHGRFPVPPVRCLLCSRVAPLLGSDSPERSLGRLARVDLFASLLEQGYQRELLAPLDTVQAGGENKQAYDQLMALLQGEAPSGEPTQVRVPRALAVTTVER